MTKIIILLAALALSATANSSAAARTQRVSCLAGHNGSLIVGVERRINGTSWSAINMCCRASKCQWTSPRTGATSSATVTQTKGKQDTWTVTVPGHVCTVISNLLAGSAGTFTQRCAHS